MLVEVTDHAQQRYLQRVRGSLSPREEIIARVLRGWERGAVSVGPKGAHDVREGSLVFVCRHDRRRRELVVITLWEEGEDPAVPQRFTRALDRG